MTGRPRADLNAGITVEVRCLKCSRRLLVYTAWSDYDEDTGGAIGEERWQPDDAPLATSEAGQKFTFSCRCGAKPQLRLDKLLATGTRGERVVLTV